MEKEIGSDPEARFEGEADFSWLWWM